MWFLTTYSAMVLRNTISRCKKKNRQLPAVKPAIRCPSCGRPAGVAAEMSWRNGKVVMVEIWWVIWWDYILYSNISGWWLSPTPLKLWFIGDISRKITMVYRWYIYILVGGWALKKNMEWKSVGMMTFPIYMDKWKMFQTFPNHESDEIKEVDI